MLTDKRRFMHMVMVAVVVSMGVVVLGFCVSVQVTVVFAQMQQNTDCKKSCRKECPRARSALSEAQGNRGPDKRSNREDGPRTCGADPALREKIESQA